MSDSSYDDNDGEFWMEIMDFKQNFYHTTICHYKENYQHISVADFHSDESHAVCRLDVEDDVTSPVYFCLHQMHKRFSATWPDNQHVYAPLQIYIARLEKEVLDKDDLHMPKDMLKLVDGAYERDKFPMIYFFRQKLQKGRYVLFYRAAFNSIDPRDTEIVYRGGKLVQSQTYIHQSKKIVLSI